MSVICWAALAATAHAQEMSFTFDETAAQQGVDTAAVEAELQGAIGGALKLNRPEEWMAQMAAANALAAQGMGVDYATNPQKFVFGASFGSAVNGAGARLGMGDAALPEAGYAVQAAVMAGLNLGAFTEEDRFARRVVVSVHGMLAGGETGAFMADFYSVGGHLQVKAVRPRQGGALEWGGLDLTGGWEECSYALTLSREIPVDSGDVGWDATGDFDIRAYSQTIPLEVSTNLRVAVVTAFVGGGVDIRQVGWAEGRASLEGPIHVEVGGARQDIGTASVELGVTEAVTRYLPRAFGGVQVDVQLVKVYGQLNATTDGGFGGHIGLRAAR